MATETECPLYDKCGFVKWRKERPYGGMTPLPENGDCGKIAVDCGRVNPEVPRGAEIYGPIFRGEIELAFKEIPNKHGRRPRRIVGGAHT
jgi:hypothetical protein